MLSWAVGCALAGGWHAFVGGWHALADSWHALVGDWRCFCGQLSVIHWSAGRALSDSWRCFGGQLSVLSWAAGCALSGSCGGAFVGGWHAFVGSWQAAFCGSLSGFRRIYLLAEDRFDFQALRGYAFCKNI